MAIVLCAVVLAVVEEFVFRGVIFGACSKVNVRAGIMISSLFFFGLLFAVVRMATDNIGKKLKDELAGKDVALLLYARRYNV